MSNQEFPKKPDDSEDLDKGAINVEFRKVSEKGEVGDWIKKVEESSVVVGEKLPNVDADEVLNNGDIIFLLKGPSTSHDVALLDKYISKKTGAMVTWHQDRAELVEFVHLGDSESRQHVIEAINEIKPHVREGALEVVNLDDPMQKQFKEYQERKKGIISVNVSIGKEKIVVPIPINASNEEAEKIVLENEAVKKAIEGKGVSKFVHPRGSRSALLVVYDL